jgi:hypothetical protein
VKLDERTAALVALVEADAAARSRAVLEPAAAQARELLRNARRAARQRVATAIAEERAAYSARVGAAEARLATARRMAEQRRLQALVAEGWERLAPALAARWRDAAGRREWVQAALDQAQALIPGGSWRVEAAAGWTEAERTQALAALAGRCIEVSFASDAAISAGLRVRSGNVELDATLAGLLADRLGVEGRLLHWHLQEPGPGTGQVLAG